MRYPVGMTDKTDQTDTAPETDASAMGASTTADIAQAAAEVQSRQQDEPAVDPVAPRERYFNRELSWLAFNERVLDEACNPAHPLLERLRFLSISGNNLDEFFMVRVAGLRGQQVNGVEQLSADGLTPAQQLIAIAESADRLMQRQQEVRRVLRDELAERDFHILHGHGVHEDEAEWLEAYFREQVLPVLTPQALDPAHPFPFIPNKGFSLVFDLKRLSDGEPIRELLMVPTTLSRFVRLPGDVVRYVAIETIIRRFTGLLFPGYAVLGDGAFRVIRDSDIEIEEEAEDLVRYYHSAIKRRRRGKVIRLRIEAGMPEPLEELVREAIGQDAALVSEASGFLGIADLEQLVEENRPDLKFPAFTARFPERIREHGGDCFAAIRDKDIVVHHPYESFEVVIAFLKQAAQDPDVVAIKQTLYRAGKQSAIIRALIDAAEAGKSVTAVVELKARFDEEQNIMWAAQLERAGVQVVYGFIDWKTHAKISMVVRRENGAIRTYCHFGTGNRRSSRRARCGAGVQLHHRLCRAARSRDGDDLAARPARAAGGTDRHGDRPCPRRARRQHLGEDELAGRSRDHREAVSGIGGGGADRSDHPRHLLPAAGGAGAEREHPRQIGGRPLPRTQPHLLLRQWRADAQPARQGLYLVGRLDAAQPRSPRRIYAADREPDRPRADIGPGDGRQPDRHRAELDVEARRQLRSHRQGGWQAVQPASLFHDEPVAVGARCGAAQVRRRAEAQAASRGKLTARRGE